MKVTITQWNGDRIQRRAGQILRDFAPQVAFQAEQEIAKRQYIWPVDTQRKNKEFVQAGLRNIIDTAQLINSATPPTVNSAGTVKTLEIEWTAPYSGAVLMGGYIIGDMWRGGYEAPARDWIGNTFTQLKPGGERPFLPYLVQRWNALAGGGPRR